MTAEGKYIPAARLLRAVCISRLNSLPMPWITPTATLALTSVLLCAGSGMALAQNVTAIPTASTAPTASITPSTPGATPQLSKATTPPAGLAALKTPARPGITNPAWKELSVTQQQALSPLSTEWDKLDATHKSKWLALIKKFVSMKPDEQIRIQERMRAWVALTPDQRRVARESYARAKKLNTDQKSAQWEQYQQLPEEQKKKLAAEAAKNKVATPPPAQSKPKNVPTLKSASKPALLDSVRPHAGGSETLGKPTAPAPDNSVVNPRVSVTNATPTAEK